MFRSIVYAQNSQRSSLIRVQQTYVKRLHQKTSPQHHLLISLSLLLVAAGLVEGGGERSSGLRSCCVCEETGPDPVLLQGEPAGWTRQHRTAPRPDWEPVRNTRTSSAECSLLTDFSSPTGFNSSVSLLFNLFFTLIYFNTTDLAPGLFLLSPLLSSRSI